MIAGPALEVEALREALAALLEPHSQQAPSLRRSMETLGEPPFGDAFAERARVALHRLIGLHAEGVIMVSSPQRKEGRSSVAAALAGVLARARGAARVLLLDLDFRRSGLAAMFSIAPTPGLADYLEDREELRAVPRDPGRELWLIPAGNHLGDPARLMHQISEPGLFSVFRDYFDWVVIDVPPILDHPEVTALAPLADWHVVVGRHRRTLLAELSKVRALLGEGPSGFLLTGDSTRMPAWLRRLI